MVKTSTQTFTYCSRIFSHVRSWCQQFHEPHSCNRAHTGQQRRVPTQSAAATRTKITFITMRVHAKANKKDPDRSGSNKSYVPRRSTVQIASSQVRHVQQTTSSICCTGRCTFCVEHLVSELPATTEGLNRILQKFALRHALLEPVRLLHGKKDVFKSRKQYDSTWNQLSEERNLRLRRPTPCSFIG